MGSLNLCSCSSSWKTLRLCLLDMHKNKHKGVMHQIFLCLLSIPLTFLLRRRWFDAWHSYAYSCACQGDKGVFYPFHWPSISKEGFSLSLKTPTSNRTLLIKDFKIFVSYHHEWEYDFLILHYLYRGYIYLPLSTASHENSDGKNLPPYCFPCKTIGSHRSIRRPDFFGSEHLISLIT